MTHNDTFHSVNSFITNMTENVESKLRRNAKAANNRNNLRSVLMRLIDADMDLWTNDIIPSQLSKPIYENGLKWTADPSDDFNRVLHCGFADHASIASTIPPQYNWIDITGATYNGKYHGSARLAASMLKLKENKTIKEFARRIANMGYISHHNRFGFGKINAEGLVVSSAILRFDKPEEKNDWDDFEKYTFSIGFASREHSDAMELIDLFCEFFYIRKNTGIIRDIIGISPSGLTIRNRELDPETAKRCPPEFYPWMKGYSVQDYFNDFLEADENVLLLMGHPRTGKSSMIETAILTMGLNCLMCSDTHLAASPEFISQLERAVTESDSDIDFVVIEDADALMRTRNEEGNRELSRLLNATAGIGKGKGFKIVLTTNKHTTEGIDPALLGPGRCADIMKFGLLSPAEAAAARAAIGLPYVDKINEGQPLGAILTDSINRLKKSAQDSRISIVRERFPLARHNEPPAENEYKHD